MRIFLFPSLLAALTAVSVFFSGCGPSEEERKVLATFNQLQEIIERDGYVKKLQRFEREEGGVYIVEAEIMNSKGEPIGRLRSERVENWGTRKPRIQWYKTPGVSEEWIRPPRRGRRGEGERGPENRANRERPNRGSENQDQPSPPPQQPQANTP